MKLLLATSALVLTLASPVVRSGHQAPHESVWTPEFPATGSTTIALYGNLSSPSPYNLYGRVSIGTPPQHFKLVFETMETMLWIPNSQPPSCPHAVYNHSESRSYEADGRGAISGRMVLDWVYGFFSRDTVRVGDFALANVTFAEATQVTRSSTFCDTEVDGWFGLALSLDENAVLQRLVSSGALDQSVFAFYLSQETMKNGDEPASAGELTLGAVNERRYTGDIHYVDTLAGKGWAVKLDAVTIGGSMVEFFVGRDGDIDAQALILPTWPFILGPSEQTKRLAKAVGTVTPQGAIDCSSQGPDIVIRLGSGEFTLTKAEYTIHLGENVCIWAFMGMDVGGWWLGQPFLKKFYSVFEFATENSSNYQSAKRIGFALAK